MDSKQPLPEFPSIPDQLITALVARFPVPIPEQSMTDREIWVRRGQYAVIEFLKLEQESQKNKTLW